MINILHHPGFIEASVFGEFSLHDFRQFENEALHEVRFQGAARLLFDLSNMATYTLDLALEEIRFVHEHRQQFERIAVVSGDQWITWSVWLNRLIVESDIQVFDDVQEARAWLAEPNSESTAA